MSPETDSTLWPTLILSYTLREEDQLLCNISLTLIVPCFSVVMDCIIIQGVKVLMKKLYTSLYCPGGRYAIFHSGSLIKLFYLVIWCNIIQEVKGLMKKFYFVLRSRRKTSFYANFRLIVVYLFLHGCGLHYNVLS